MRIAITGASGYIGRHTATSLIARGVKPTELVLITRNPDALAGMTSLGADVRRGDFKEPSTLPAAFVGVERVFFISVAPEGLVSIDDQASVQEVAIAAAVAAGVKHGVLQSSVGTTLSPEPPDEVDVRTERALRNSGMTWTILRTAAFADSRGRDAKRILREGRFVTNLGAGRPYYVTRDDIALAAAAVLATPGHAGRIYNLVGQPTSVDEVIETLCELSGKPLTRVDVSDEVFAAGLVQRGRLARLAATATSTHRKFRDGQVPPPCDLPKLIGRAGLSVPDFLRANAHELLTGSPPEGREALLL